LGEGLLGDGGADGVCGRLPCCGGPGLPEFKGKFGAGRCVVGAAIEGPVQAEEGSDGGEVGVVADEEHELLTGWAERAGDGSFFNFLLKGPGYVKKELAIAEAGESRGAMQQVEVHGVEREEPAKLVFVDVAPTDIGRGHRVGVLKEQVFRQGGGCGKRAFEVDDVIAFARDGGEWADR
jgi:hypothetical protein